MGSDVDPYRPLLPDIAGRFYSPLTFQPCTDLRDVEGLLTIPQVALTELTWAERARAHVSTVFLWINHAMAFLGEVEPVLWETMIFSSDLDEVLPELEYRQGRYTSQDDAIRCHYAIVETLTGMLVRLGYAVTARERDCPLLALQATYQKGIE